jgi:AcrR family transcriptional regulator
LLDAAVDIFSEKGMGITIQALADRVSVTQPLVHRYFRTRVDLIAGNRRHRLFDGSLGLGAVAVAVAAHRSLSFAV